MQSMIMETITTIRTRFWEICPTRSRQVSAQTLSSGLKPARIEIRALQSKDTQVK